MSIVVIARFSAAYASLAKLVLVSSRGTSSVGRSSRSAGRWLVSGIFQVYGIPEAGATAFRNERRAGGAPHNPPARRPMAGCAALHPPYDARHARSARTGPAPPDHPQRRLARRLGRGG